MLLTSCNCKLRERIVGRGVVYIRLYSERHACVCCRADVAGVFRNKTAG